MAEAVILALCLSAGAARAQTVRGQVIEAATGTPVDGGFVLLLDSDGKEVARTLADHEGRFTVRAPGAGAYRLRSERIGFKVVTSPALELAAGQTLEYQLSAAGIPIRLEEIRVESDSRCRVRPEEGRATATVWEEARKALIAVAWVQRQQRLRARLRTYERDLSTDLRVIKEESRERSGTANKVFTAIPARDLAARGYVERTPDGGLLFQAPDADVLFSDEFLNRHCFRLEARGDSATAGLIGLGFEPARGQALPDIKGVMWLDEKSAELRYVEFRYTRVDLPVATDVAGGRVDFERLANGGWMVSRFWIRMPKITSVRGPALRSVADAVRGGMRMETRAELTGISEVGGEVLEVFGMDGARVASSAGASLAGTVFDSTRAVPLIGARIRLGGTEYGGLSGPGGEFRIDGLPQGDYTVEFSHPDFPAWGALPGVPLASLRRGQVTRVELAVPSPGSLLRRWCPEADLVATGVAGGVVTDSATGRPVKDAAVQFIWERYDVKAVDGSRGQGALIKTNRSGIEVKTDAAGYFRACGLPGDHPIEAWVVTGGTERKAATFTVGKGELQELRLR